MKALVKSRAEPGLWLEDVPEPEIGINDVLIRVGTTRDLRHRRAHPPLGRVGAADDPGAARGRPRVRRRGRRGRRERERLPARATVVSGEGHVVCGRCRNCMAGRRHLCAHTIGLGVHRPGAFAELRRAADDERLAPLAGHRPTRSPRSSTRSATPCTPRSRSRSSARTCSSPAPGRSAAWRPRSRATPARATSSSPT